MAMEIKLTGGSIEFESIRKNLKLFQKSYEPNMIQVLIQSQDGKSCGIYPVRKSLQNFLYKLERNNQAYIILGESNSEGMLILNK